MSRIRVALRLLGHPEENFAAVIVGGTNGKGSTSAFLESILRCAGYRTGLFTSPHLINVRERIRVEGRDISSRAWRRLFHKVRALMARKRLPLTEFEAQSLIAFLYFSEMNVDIAVVEVGLGGRLDSTNALPAPEATVITSVGHDHHEWLGHNLHDIFREKRGICRPGTPHFQSLPSSLEDDGSHLCRNELIPANHLGREIRVTPGHTDWSRGRQLFDVRLPGKVYGGLSVTLFGPHQIDNAALAVATAHSLRQRGWCIDEHDVRDGLATARWPGRFQIFRRKNLPVAILDGAHNSEAMDSFVAAYRSSPWGRKTSSLIFGCLKDKDAKGMIRRLRPIVHRVFNVPLDSTRARNPRMIDRLWGSETPSSICRNFPEAWSTATRDPRSPVLITGSLYLVGSAMKELGVHP